MIVLDEVPLEACSLQWDAVAHHQGRKLCDLVNQSVGGQCWHARF